MTEPTPNAVNALADRFWEAILELNPTTATMYGDERYADRLEDPSEVGRDEGARPLALAPAARPRPSRPTVSRSRTGSPST